MFIYDFEYALMCTKHDLSHVPDQFSFFTLIFHHFISYNVSKWKILIVYIYIAIQPRNRQTDVRYFLGYSESSQMIVNKKALH